MNRIRIRNLLRAVALAAVVTSAWTIEASDSKVAQGRRTYRKTGAEVLQEKWGIQVESVRLSANGFLVDFRYKVLNSEKAARLGDPEIKPYLVDRASGAKLHVPSSPKVGPLRQSTERLSADRVYFTLFSNKGRAVKVGSKVTVVMGDFKIENVVVQ